MKKIIKICLILISLLFVCNVYAANCNDYNNLEVGCVYPHVPIDTYKNRIMYIDNYYKNSYSWDIKTNLHYINALHRINVNGTDIPIFCMDPAGFAPQGNYDTGYGKTSYKGDNTLKVQRLLYGEDNTYVKAEDYAMATILANSSFSNRYDASFSWDEYNAVSIAIRMFRNGVLQDVLPYTYDTKGGNAKRITFRYINTLAHWVNEDAELRTEYNKACKNIKASGLYPSQDCDFNNILAKLRKSYNFYYTVAEIQDEFNKIVGAAENAYDSYFVDAFYSTKGDGAYLQNDKEVLATGKKYLLAGIKAYNKALEGEITVPTAVVTEEETIKGTHESTVIVAVNFKNFSDSFDTSSFVIDNLQTTSSSAIAQFLGYNSSVPKDANDYKTTNERNIYKLAGGNKKIYLVFKITSNIAVESDENCNINFILNYKYYDPRLYSGAQLRIGNHMGGDGEKYFQRFITFSSGTSSSLTVQLKQCETICKPQNYFPEKCTDSSKVEKGQVVATFKEGYDESNRLNIDKCIVGNTDINGNSYAVASYRDNPYCNVYCKEDLDIRMPYKLETYAGRTINLDVVITGTQSCYTSKIDYTQYHLDLARATGLERQNVENNYNACMNINVGYNLNPKITYTYEELVGREGTMVIKNSAKCTGNATLVDGKCVTESISKKYGTDQYMKETTIVATYTTPRIYYVSNTNLGLIKLNIGENEMPYFVRVNGLPIDINTPAGTYNYTIDIDNVGTFYSDSSDKLGRIYGKVNSLSAYREDGGKEVKNKYACTYGVNVPDNQDYCINEDEVMVPMDCEENETTEHCKQRFCPNPSVTPKCIKEQGTYYVCKSDHYDKDKCEKKGTSKDARKQALKEVGCLDANGNEIPNCKQNVSCCPKCEIIIVEAKKCPACIVTNGGITVDYRTISTSNINPNENRGYNWNQNTSGPIGIKADYTITEIEQSEEKRFEDSVNGGGVLTDNYTLRVIMTPSMAKDIRDYNDEHNESGSYTNNSLACTDYEVNKTEASCEADGYSWINGKCVIDNIFCYSTFIDWLIEIYPDNVLAPNRSEAKENNASFENYTVDGIDSQKANVKTNGYWTIFPDYVLDSAGPSWK